MAHSKATILYFHGWFDNWQVGSSSLSTVDGIYNLVYTFVVVFLSCWFLQQSTSEQQSFEDVEEEGFKSGVSSFMLL